jgi:ATP-binding cassette subfamily B protein
MRPPETNFEHTARCTPEDGVPVPKAVLKRPFLSLLRYTRPYWRAYACGAVLAVFFVGTDLAIPMVVRDVVAGFEQGVMSMGRLWTCFGLLLGLSLVTCIARYFQRTLMIGASRRFEYDLRNDYFQHLQRLSSSFFHRVQTGDIMARAVNDLNYVRDFIGPGVMGSVDMIRLPLTVVMMIYLSPLLTLMTMIPMPLVSLLVFFFVRYMNRQSKVVQELFSGVTDLVQENLAGTRVVKAYGIADREIRRFRKDSVRYMRENLWLAGVMSLAWPLIGLVIGSVILIVMWQGGAMVIRGSLSLANLTAFMIYLVMLAFPLAQFGWVLTLYQRGAVGMNRLAEILCETPEIQDNEQTQAEARIREGNIRFENVSFSYRSSGDGAAPEVLHGVSFEIPAGSTVAMVGPTGSGKSTLVSLMTREYDPTGGRVLVDGMDLRTIPVQALREAIGYVPQDTFVFSESIRDNICMGLEPQGDERLRTICGQAQFLEPYTQMPDGVDTLLGERGVNLSGGQRQRLTLARALIKNPRLLILDDAFSSVDTHTEEQILQRVREVLASRTCVLISHRISTVRQASRIFVIDDGNIAEQGTHDELLAKNGLYARMYRRQLLEQALEEDRAQRDAPL